VTINVLRVWQSNCRIKAYLNIACGVPAVLWPCRFASDFSTSRHSTAGARHGRGEVKSAVSRRPVGDAPRFGFFRLRRGVSRLVISDLPGYTRNFTKDTALSEDGRDTAWYVWISLKCKASTDDREYSNMQSQNAWSCKEKQEIAGILNCQGIC
jgi:hypothetical protein